MKLSQRIKKLEETIYTTNLDPSSNAELKEWLNLHPAYSPFVQPENNHGIVMPEHLNQALWYRIEKIFAERGLPSNLCSLLAIYQDLCNGLSSTKAPHP